MNPETIVDLWRSYQLAAAGADAHLRLAIEMKGEGYSYDEIATALGRGPRMVPRYIAELRSRIQRQRSEPQRDTQ